LKPPKLSGGGIAEGLSVVSSVPPTPVSGFGGEDFDHSLRTQHPKSPWSGVQLTPSRRPKQHQKDHHQGRGGRYAPEIVMGTPTPVSSAYTVNEDDFLTPTHRANATGAPGVGVNALGHRGKFANSYPAEVRVLMRRNFTVGVTGMLELKRPWLYPRLVKSIK
jgi:hypothetical protein